ncbi:flagellar biosynthesis regulator FlaF [Novispirillum sp. DQ9]|uniref:flagellar biosynthesis regulator FlaF n=1 Tax=Novispirillum sp. DQ9 TaxID=3398612 RepID=UPI003C7E529C
MTGFDAYRRAQAATAHVDARQVEADALLRIARELEQSQEAGGKPLVEALFRNIQVWKVFGFDCAGDGNRLPADLKAQIISLSVWVVAQSEKAMAGDVGVDALIDVNRTIARGLMTGIAAGQGNAPATIATDSIPGLGVA